MPVVAARAARMTGDDRAPGDHDLCAPFLAALPGCRAAITTLSDPFGVGTICASDPLAARYAELQLDLGVGPIWAAQTSGRAVLSAHPDGPGDGGWPGLSTLLDDERIVAIHAVPLITAGLRVGVVGLYSESSDALGPSATATIQRLAHETAVHLLRRIVAGLPDDDAPYSRRSVHQATGMVLVQLEMAPADALLVIRAYAFATARSVREVALDIIRRRIDFSRLDASD